MNNNEQEISARLGNSLKQFNVTLKEAINIEPFKLKQIGFGNRSIIELQSLKEITLEEDEFCYYNGLPSPKAYEDAK